MTRQMIGILILTGALLTGCGDEDPIASRPAVDNKVATGAKMDIDTPTAADAKTIADENMAAVTSLLTKLQQYIKDNKLDLAEAALKQLDGMKESIPASLQEKIEAARTALAAKKTASQLLK